MRQDGEPQDRDLPREDGMNNDALRRANGPGLAGLLTAVILMLAVIISWAPRAGAQSDDALQILKKMSDYLASQSTLSVAFDTDIEVITSDLEKIQFASSSDLEMSRPDKLLVHRVGGYADVELAYDGKTLTLYGKHINSFAQLADAGTIDQLADHLTANYGMAAPGADLLRSDVYEALAADVLEAKHIGRGVINGVECEHLAFRNHDTDWQIWIEVGDRPIPWKFVITSKTVSQAPQYTLRMREWKTGTQVKASAFEFKPPQGATKVAFESLQGFDEVPPGVAPGASQ